MCAVGEAGPWADAPAGANAEKTPNAITVANPQHVGLVDRNILAFLR